jgi:hypothetical protein
LGETAQRFFPRRHRIGRQTLANKPLVIPIFSRQGVHRQGFTKDFSRKAGEKQQIIPLFLDFLKWQENALL